MKVLIWCMVRYVDDASQIRRAEFQRTLELLERPQAGDLLWGLMTNVPAGAECYDDDNDKYTLKVHSVMLDFEQGRSVVFCYPLRQELKKQEIVQAALSGGSIPIKLPGEEWVGKHFSKTAWKRETDRVCSAEG